MRLDQTARMMRTLCRKVSGVRLICGGKRAQVVRPAIEMDGALPSSVGLLVCAKYLRFGMLVRTPLVLQIDAVCYLAEIQKAVVQFVAVNVVNVLRRPNACDVQPCQAVPKTVFAVNANNPIPVLGVNGTSNLSGSPSAHFPVFSARKNASVRVVREVLAQAFGSNHYTLQVG